MDRIEIGKEHRELSQTFAAAEALSLKFRVYLSFCRISMHYDGPFSKDLPFP
jgi:hypothetical protein